MGAAADPVEGFPERLREKFTPVKLLGAGGMGCVYLVTDRALDRPVALKLITGTVTEKLILRMQREARALAKLEHPNVLRIYSFDEGDVRGGLPPYLVTEYVEGENLLQPLRGADPRAIMFEVAEGLETVHRAGLVHRDVKPDNILLTRDLRPVLADFGLAFDPDWEQVTKTGENVGTLPYMAFELFETGIPDPASDFYAWGATLYCLLERKPPYTALEVMEAVSGRGFPELRFQNTPPEGPTARLLRATLSVDPAKRPTSCRGLRDLMKGTRYFVRPSSPVRASSPTRSRGVVGGLLALGLAFGFFTATNPGPTEPPTTPASPSSESPGEKSWEPFGRDYPDRVRAELEVVDSPDPDPAHWGQVLVRLPEVQRFYSWLLGGGRPEGLPEEFRRALREVDADFRGQALARPFHPFAYVTPLPARRPPPRKVLEEFRHLGLQEGVEQLGGWADVAVQAADRLFEREKVDRDRLLGGKTDDLPAPFTPKYLASTTMLVGTSLKELVGHTWSAARNRGALQDFLGEGVDDYEVFVYALARSIREEPETADALAATLARRLDTFSAYLYQPGAYRDPALLIGRTPVRPAGWLLRAWFHRALHFVRGKTEEDTAAIREEADRSWVAAQGAAGEDRAGRARASVAAFGYLPSLAFQVRTKELRNHLNENWIALTKWAPRYDRRATWALLHAIRVGKTDLGLDETKLNELFGEHLRRLEKDAPERASITKIYQRLGIAEPSP